jgi:hypothetical protein
MFAESIAIKEHLTFSKNDEGVRKKENSTKIQKKKHLRVTFSKHRTLTSITTQNSSII